MGLPYHITLDTCSNMSKTATANRERKRALQLFRAPESSRLNLKECNERQDTIFPSIQRLGINFVIEPLDNRLLPSSIRSFFLLQFAYFVIEFWLSAAKVIKQIETTKLFPRFCKKKEVFLPISSRSARQRDITGIPYKTTFGGAGGNVRGEPPAP